MASQLSSWYTGQYSNWNRTRRLHQTPYLARPETNTSRQARTMAQATTVAAINGLGSGGPPPKDSSKEKKGPETLFGPNIGVISGGPAWTNATEKKVLKDELTMDVVKSWIEKSKEPTQPTTTLQALVNLKRPTIRLSPLETLEGDESHHGSQHALEFEYDCDAPKCGIYVHVLLPPGHPDAAPTPLASDGASPKLSKFLVFESVVDGGYGNILKLEEGAILELGRFETTHEDAGKSSSDMNSASVPATSGASVPTAGAEAPSSAHPNSRRKRLTHLFTKRHNNRNMSVSGPALAVVDASSPDNSHPTEVDKLKKGDADDGIKVTIRIAALDEQGTELASPNEQVTYLSVERFGPKVKHSPAAATNAESGGEEASPAPEVKPEDEEDTRPWVVKVVKREATIGAHTFHLHEIYGLTASSSSTHTHAPTAPLPSTHTYPPVAGAPVVEPNDTNDDSPSECLLCLSSPREVVLLPCRHLVACKDCALNMVEFGAGGNITQPADEPPATADGAAEGGEASASGTGGGEATTPAPLPTRRKRKAKGWFCPVCRQPYTSLLRITTTPPNTNETKNEAPSPDPRPEESDDDHDEGVDQDIADASPSGLPLPVTAEAPTSAQPQTTQTTADVTSGGLFTRPGFLRGLTGRGNGSRSDLESQL